MHSSHLSKNQKKYEKENQQLQSDPQLQQQNNEDEMQQHPQFTEVDGKVMKLGGLDYNLLKQQKMQEDKQKRSFMDSLKLKIGNIMGDVAERTSKNQYQKEKVNSKNMLQKNNNDNKYNGLIKVVNEISNTNTQQNFEKSTHNKKSETYLNFFLGQLDQRVPMRVEKRVGKGSNNQMFVELDQKFLSQYQRMINDLKEKKTHKISNRNSEAMLQKVEAGSDSDDDIFGDGSGNDNEMRDQRKNQKNGEKINIQIGKKLDFNIEEDIFSNLKRPKPIGGQDISIKIEKTDSQKYSFMPQKRKPVLNSQQDDGYGECYYQSGPSLQQLVDLKKQGIQYYGDLKQFKAKERKVNINKQYDMVQKIIESKKKQGS